MPVEPLSEEIEQEVCPIRLREGAATRVSVVAAGITMILSAGGLATAEPHLSMPDQLHAQDRAAGDSLLPSAPASLGALPAWFVENRGQDHPDVFFLWRSGPASVYFTPDGVTTALEEGGQRWAVETAFVGARAVAPVGTRRDTAVVSYFKGSAHEWVTGARTYSEIVYRGLWPGIDLVYLAHGGHLKYEFRVAPGADPSRILISYDGASSVDLRETGGVVVTTPAGAFVEEPPVSFQPLGNSRRTVPSRYILEGTTLRFGLGAYDRTKPLVIDPVVVLQSGYIGGSGLDEAYGIAVEGDGSSYVAGKTHSGEGSFPVKSGPDLTYNGSEESDAFVAKLDPSGSSLVYLGYIGGSSEDVGSDVAVDSTGAAYVTGRTESSQASFPVLGGPDLTSNEGGDTFVAKVNPSGTSLSYSGYIGGAGSDAGNGVAVDGAGNAYVVGDTDSTEATFPVRTGPDVSYNGQGDAFVAKVTSSGASLSYAGYLGGSEWDIGNAIAVDGSGNAYLAGMASSSQATFPETGGPDLTHNGGGDAFVAKVGSTGGSLSYAGYIGGSDWDAAWGVAVDSAGTVHVAGDTESAETSFPVRGGPDTSYNGSSDAFVARLTADGASLAWAGYVGGSGNDYAGYHSVAVDDLGNAYLTGVTNSTAPSFPATSGPDLSHNGANDAYVAKLTPSGAVTYAGFIGGSQFDSGYGIAVGPSRVAYVTGGTNSSETSFPVAGGPDQTLNDDGIGDAFITKVGVLHPLNVSKGGSGTGMVTSSPVGIACGTDCSEDYLEGTSVTLTATSTGDARFGGWNGACSGTETTCTVSLAAPKTATATFLETVPPETSIISGPSAQSRFPTAQFVFTSNESGSTFGCSLDGGPFDTCTGTKSYSNLGEGPHEFRARATDGSGNVDPTPAVWTWRVDLTPPDTTITSGPSGTTTSAEASFSFTSEPLAVFNCSLDGSAFSRCGASMNYSGLSDGTHTLRVAAEDQAGNVDPSPATRTWVVDARGPFITFDRPSTGLYVNDQSFGGTGPTVVFGHVTVEARANDAESGVASFGFEVNGTPVDPSQVTLQNGVYRFSFRPSSAGQYTITARSTNGSGIASSSAIQVFGSPAQ